jgi:hypothetical protein
VSSSNDLSSLANQPPEGSQIFRGKIADDATSPNDLIHVRIPDYHPGQQFGPCRFSPRPLMDGGTLLPLRDDPCLVALDENDEAELINWWAEDPTDDLYVNAGSILTFTHTTPASAVPNNSIFRDSADGIIKIKDATGVLRSLY